MFARIYYYQVSGIHDSHAFDSMGYDNTLNLSIWKKKLSMELLSVPSDPDLVFSLVGVEAPIANAFRRILIADVCQIL